MDVIWNEDQNPVYVMKNIDTIVRKLIMRNANISNIWEFTNITGGFFLLFLSNHNAVHSNIIYSALIHVMVIHLYLTVIEIALEHLTTQWWLRRYQLVFGLILDRKYKIWDQGAFQKHLRGLKSNSSYIFNCE